MKYYKFVILILITLTFSSCEDVIDVKLDQGTPLLVVDAFITNEHHTQIIKLTKSSPYFDNAPSPTVDDATINLFGSDNSHYAFINQGNGEYVWKPIGNEAIDSIGINYKLQIDYHGKSYISSSILNPVPPIDTITFNFVKAGFGQSRDGYQAEFFATDIPGRDDFYWIKAYKNGKKVGSAESFNTTENGAFGGTDADGLLFIYPVRVFAINDSSAYQLNDSIRVEVWSINETIADFFNQVQTQTNNGGIFSVPPSNVEGNIKDINGNIATDALGAFCISAVSKKTQIVK